MLPGSGEEVSRRHIIHAVLDEDYLAILDGILGYLCQCLVDVGLRHRHRVSAVIIDCIVRERLEEAPYAEEIGQVLPCNLTHFADKLQAACVGAVRRQRVVAKGIEERRIERRVPLCKMVVEVELPIHAHLAVERASEERFVACILVHDSGKR